MQQKEIIEVVKKTIQEELQKEASNFEYISRKEMCRRLEISMPTLTKWTEEGLISGRYIISGAIRYKWSEVENSLNAHIQ